MLPPRCRASPRPGRPPAAVASAAAAARSRRRRRTGSVRPTARALLRAAPRRPASKVALSSSRLRQQHPRVAQRELAHLHPEQRAELWREPRIRKRALESELAVRDACDAYVVRRAEVAQQVHVVGDADDAAPLLPQLAEQAIHVDLLRGIEVIGGLV